MHPRDLRTLDELTRHLRVAGYRFEPMHLATELLARELGADLYVMLTDADAVYEGWGTPQQRAMRRASPDALAAMQFAAGSMGPKVDAACRFARATGKRAAIGELSQLGRILAGEAGTTIDTATPGIVWAT